MSRQIVNTNGQGRAQSTARTFTAISVVVAIVVLIVFYLLSFATKGQAQWTAEPSQGQTNQGTSAMGAPPAMAK